MISNVKVSIDEVFCFRTTLEVLNINSNDSYIRFGKSFDDLETWYKNGVFKYVSTFNHCFYNICSKRKISIFDEVVLQTQDLSVDQANKPCIKLTQENSIEFLVQHIYLYILTSNGLYSTSLAYLNDHVLAIRSIYIIYIV